MEIKFSEAKWSIDERGTWVSILVPPQSTKLAIKTIEELNGTQTLVIKKYRKQRSPDANAYCWVLLGKLADALRKGKEELYLEMLKEYGQMTVVSVREDATEVFTRGVRYFDVFGQGELNGKTYNHIKVYSGSSTFNTKEMAIFLDGIISECEALGIETATPEEQARMKASWKGYGG